MKNLSHLSLRVLWMHWDSMYSCYFHYHYYQDY